MGFINIKIDKVIVTQDDEVKKLLQEISDKLDKLSDDPNIILKAAKDLDTVGNDLKAAVDKNTPS